ncbi:hypothetical protein V2J09_009877 [Rumex salicifolius]
MVIDDDTESCSSRAMEMAPTTSRLSKKAEVFNDVLLRLQHSDCEEARLPGFDDQLWFHFLRLPDRYAVDMNVERADDVLYHMRLLHRAKDPANRPALDVRLVEANTISKEHADDSVDSYASKYDAIRSFILNFHLPSWDFILTSFCNCHEDFICSIAINFSRTNRFLPLRGR